MAAGRVDRAVILGASALHGMLDIARTFGHRLKRVEIESASGVDARVWIGSRFRDDDIEFGTWVEVGTTFAPGTLDATLKSDAGSTDELGNDSTANDGIGIQAVRPFDWLVFSISTLSDGAVTWDIEYWNGSAWTNVTLLEGSLTALGVSTGATGEYLVLIQLPTDWAKFTNGDQPVADGFQPGFYGMRLREAGAATTAPEAQYIHIGRTRWHVPIVAAGGAYAADDQRAVICHLYDRPVVIFNQAAAHRVTFHSVLVSSQEVMGDPFESVKA